MNEKERLKERYITLNIPELQRVARQALGEGEEPCPNITRLAEGGFNRVFLLKSKRGHEVIAWLPTPVAGAALYTTASEVATLKFLRDVLGVPVPRVLGYSATPENGVGAEYIIMERVRDVSLAERCDSLSGEEVKSVMVQIVKIERKIFDCPFAAYGSIYLRKDFEEIGGKNGVPLPDQQYCIGPVAARQYWHGKRSKTKIDRGPWTSAIECFTSAARRDKECNIHHAKHRSRKTFLLPTTHDIDPFEHTSLLASFLDLASELIPANPPHCAPTLRHPDLSLSNIMLEPDSSKIISIIDWQGATVFPLFMQAGYPAFCEHDSTKPQSLQQPTLPDNFDSMSAEEQNQAKANALRMPHRGMRQYLFQQTGYPWDGDVVNLRAALIGITTPHIWSAISSNPCPINFTDDERRTAIEESNEWNESEKLLFSIRDHLGIDLEGGTETANYEWALKRNAELRLACTRQAGPDENEQRVAWQNWSFKDDADTSLPPST
ncbi:kinase-like domain-containing protein [Aspergillus venezuelensis]